jgi:hydrogenase expression/formation protein HypE
MLIFAMDKKNKNILLSHGSGGRLMHSLIRDIFFTYFKNDMLDKQTDSSVFKLDEGYFAFTTDSYVVKPIFFPGGDIGKLAVCGTVNDLAVSGARPLYLSAGFILEEGFPISELEAVVKSMAETAQKAGVKIVTGDTKVVNKGACDKIFINTSGIGYVANEHKDLASGKLIKPGDQIIINGNIAEHGTAILGARENLELTTPVKSDAAPLNLLIGKLLSTFRTIRFMRDPTRGGLATTMVEVAGTVNMGIELNETSIPVTDEVRGICELLGFDPLFMANEGKFMMIAGADEAEAIIDFMRHEEHGQKAAIIGSVVNEHPGKVVLKTSIGGHRLLDMLTGDQLPRIC